MKTLVITTLMAVLGTGTVGISQTSPKQNRQLTITTVVPKGSVQVNEFGEQSDWLEITNTGTRPLNFKEDRWYISDDPRRPGKFRLRKGELDPGESMIIWCDDRSTSRNQVHANFKLSSLGETLIISNKTDKRFVTVDEISYSALTENGQMALSRHGEENLIQKPLKECGAPLPYTATIEKRPVF